MNRTIAITGATGFAGRHAVAEFLAQGHRLRALVRDPARGAIAGRSGRWLRGDLGNDEALSRLARRRRCSGASGGRARGGSRAMTISASMRMARWRWPRRRIAQERQALRPRLFACRTPAATVALWRQQAGRRRCDRSAGGQAQRHHHPPARRLWSGRPRHAAAAQGTDAARRRHSRPPRRRASRSFMWAIWRGSSPPLQTSDVAGLHEVSDGTEGGYRWADLLAIAAAVARRADHAALFLPSCRSRTVWHWPPRPCRVSPASPAW